MLDKYKEIMTPSTGRGLEEKPHGARQWILFDAINKFMSERHTIKPLLLLESNLMETSTSSETVQPDGASSLCADTHPSLLSNFSEPLLYSAPAISTPAVSSSAQRSQHSSLPSTSVSQRALLLEEEADDPIVHPAIQRRHNTRKRDVIEDLVSVMKEDMEKQDRRRQEARELDTSLIDVLRDFLEKQSMVFN